MKFARYFWIVLLLSSLAEVSAQSVLNCLIGGKYLPVAEIRNTIPYCFTGDSVVRGSKKELALLPADEFADGFVEVAVNKNERSGVVNENGILVFVSPRDWYSFVATITPDRDLSDCYFAVGFDTYGVKSYYTKALGDLEAGKNRTIRVYMKLRFEMPDQLHIFSGMEEIRTSLVPSDYSYRNGDLLLAAK